LRSIRLFFRERRESFRRQQRNERGFALILALFLGVLYFGFIELLMYDASREMSEARRFRARIVALTLAENGAELAATQMITQNPAPSPETDWQGTTSGKLTKTVAVCPVDQSCKFEIKSTARSAGREGTDATLWIEGRILEGTQIQIQFARHSQ
jgi:hypothetical protein